MPRTLKEDVGYRALHNWLNRHMPRKDYCEKCSVRGQPLHIASKERKYTREFSDYFFLCRSCHVYHDMKPDTKLKQSLAKIGKKTWNTGSKGVMKANKTSFQKGLPPPPHKPHCKCFRCHRD